MEQLSPPSQAIHGSTERAKAAFERAGDTAHLRIEYDVPQIEIDSQAANKQQAVAEACAKEIAFVQDTFQQLLHDMLGQMSPSLGMADLERKSPHWDEKRIWTFDPNHLRVRPNHTVTEMRATADGKLPAADVLRAAFNNLGIDRELAVRSMYRQVAIDVATQDGLDRQQSAQ